MDRTRDNKKLQVITRCVMFALYEIGQDLYFAITSYNKIITTLYQMYDSVTAYIIRECGKHNSTCTQL